MRLSNFCSLLDIFISMILCHCVSICINSSLFLRINKNELNFFHARTENLKDHSANLVVKQTNKLFRFSNTVCIRFADKLLSLFSTSSNANQRHNYLNLALGHLSNSRHVS